MIKEIQGDITALDFPVDIILQCCNTKCTQKAGVALALTNKWPQVYEADVIAASARSNRLGDISSAEVTLDTGGIALVVNLYGQTLIPGRRRQLNYEALYLALEEVVVEHLTRDCIVAVPKYMGSALAGGSWSIVLPMLKQVIEPNCKELVIVDYTKRTTESKKEQS